MFNKHTDDGDKPKKVEECCGQQIQRRPSIKEEAQFTIERHLNQLEHSRKLIKFVERFPDAAKYLEDNNFSVYGGL